MHNLVLFYLGSRSTFQTRSFAQRVLTAPRRLPNDEVTKRANLPPRDTRTMQSNRFVCDDVTRGPSKGPVSRAMESDDECWRKLDFGQPLKCCKLNFDCFSFLVHTHTFLLYSRHIYRRKKEHEKKTFQTSGMHSDVHSGAIILLHLSTVYMYHIYLPP